MTRILVFVTALACALGAQLVLEGEAFLWDMSNMIKEYKDMNTWLKRNVHSDSAYYNLRKIKDHLATSEATMKADRLRAWRNLVSLTQLEDSSISCKQEALDYIDTISKAAAYKPGTPPKNYVQGIVDLAIDDHKIYCESLLNKEFRKMLNADLVINELKLFYTIGINLINQKRNDVGKYRLTYSKLLEALQKMKTDQSYYRLFGEAVIDAVQVSKDRQLQEAMKPVWNSKADNFLVDKQFYKSWVKFLFDKCRSYSSKVFRIMSEIEKVYAWTQRSGKLFEDDLQKATVNIDMGFISFKFCSESVASHDATLLAEEMIKIQEYTK